MSFSFNLKLSIYVIYQLVFHAFFRSSVEIFWATMKTKNRRFVCFYFLYNSIPQSFDIRTFQCALIRELGRFSNSDFFHRIGARIFRKIWIRILDGFFDFLDQLLRRHRKMKIGKCPVWADFNFQIWDRVVAALWPGSKLQVSSLLKHQISLTIVTKRKSTLKKVIFFLYFCLYFIAKLKP